QAGFEICNWISNSKEVLLGINKTSEGTNDSKTRNFCEERVLGLIWNYEKDVFKFNLKFQTLFADILSLNRRPTKREILKLTMSIYDPLGFLANVLITSKILLQTI
ncbi:hypothetical protein KR222_002149, partial [Zaprionus bogoriensis]